MNTKRVVIEDVKHPRDEELLEAAEILRAGGLVAFPTETVYGLGANALNEEAAKKIYAAKGRPSDNPLIAHISGENELRPLVSEIPEAGRKLMEAFWPGPLTIIFPKSEAVPYGTTGGLDTVAVRMPSDPVANRLIALAGVPVAAPSANTSGRPSPTTADHVWEDMNGKIEMILDGGPVGIGVESTIVDVTGEVPMLLRPGGGASGAGGDGSRHHRAHEPGYAPQGARDEVPPLRPQGGYDLGGGGDGGHGQGNLPPGRGEPGCGKADGDRVHGGDQAPVPGGASERGPLLQHGGAFQGGDHRPQPLRGAAGV